MTTKIVVAAFLALSIAESAFTVFGLDPVAIMEARR